VLPPDSGVAPLLPLGEAWPRVVHVGTVTLPYITPFRLVTSNVIPLNMWSFARTIHHWAMSEVSIRSAPRALPPSS
jgi:hypothetical protein